jgi:SAM-dependent methyltransferase
VSDAQREQTELWNGASGDVWIAEQALLDGMFAAIEAHLADVAAQAGARSVLDVGCGTGTTTLALARRLGPAATCTGVDLSAPMIAVARGQAGRVRAPARFIVADAAAHPFEPEGFDLVVSRFGVMFFADPVAAFANLHRATAPGGALHLVVWRGPEDNPFMTTASRAAAPLLAPDALPQPRPPGAPGQFGLADPDRTQAILADAGWRDADLQPRDFPCTMPAAALRGYLSRLGPLGLVLRDADEATRDRILAAVLPAFDGFRDGDELRFDAACWLVRATA